MIGSAMTAGDYQLGSDDKDLERLSLQGEVLAPTTRTLLQAGGLVPGMRVLDLGSGAGDVAFVAADLVGPSGDVVGIDRSPEAVARADKRARERALDRISFFVGDIHDPAPEGPFDAIIGRLVLMYVPDPAAVLRTQATRLRPGGVVIPIEFDIHSAGSHPSTPLVRQVVSWLAEAFKRSGIELSLGQRLWSVLVDAGLRPVGMIGVQPYFGPEDPDGAALLAGIVQTALPLIERAGVATAEEVRAETLRQRLSDELTTASAVFAHPILVSAWATIDRSL